MAVKATPKAIELLDQTANQKYVDQTSSQPEEYETFAELGPVLTQRSDYEQKEKRPEHHHESMHQDLPHAQRGETSEIDRRAMAEDVQPHLRRPRIRQEVGTDPLVLHRGV